MEAIQKPLKRFILIFGLVYLGLVSWMPNSVVHDGFDDLLVDRCSTFESFYGDGRCFCDREVGKNEDGFRIRVSLYSSKQNEEAVRNGTQIQVVRTFFNTRVVVLLPFCLLMALILASPVSWLRKLIGLVAGILILYLSVIGLIRVQIAYEFHANTQLEVVQLAEWKASFYAWIRRTFTNNMVLMLMLPVFIWPLVTFRQTDFKFFLNQVNNRLS